ncbi:MAG: thioredoxin [Candidatus Micrarchaeota archaeon]|nr:thioredoxin [Candidatus Micrarchaeota archaeon]
MAVKELNVKIFDAETAKGTTLVDFWATWCGPCRLLAPVIEEISEANKAVKFGKVDINAQQELAARFGVMSIPTLVLFKDGEEADRLIGAYPREIIERWIKEKG